MLCKGKTDCVAVHPNRPTTERGRVPIAATNEALARGYRATPLGTFNPGNGQRQLDGT